MRNRWPLVAACAPLALVLALAGWGNSPGGDIQSPGNPNSPVSGSSASYTGDVTSSTMHTGTDTVANSNITSLTAASEFVTGTSRVANANITSATVGTVSSAAGFKTLVGPAVYYHSAYPGNIIPAYFVYVNSSTGTTAAISNYSWVAPFAGSVVGVSAFSYGAVSGRVDIWVYKNYTPANSGSTGVLFTTTGIIASGQQKGYATFAKGTYGFAAGDIISISFGAGTTGIPFGVTYYLVVELGA